jgi:hypothetical protein
VTEGYTVTDYNLESKKLQFEFYKHLTVVSTAAAVLVPPVADALNPGTTAPIFTLICLSVSVVLGLIGMFVVTQVLDSASDSPPWLLVIAPIPFVVGLGFFLFIVVRKLMEQGGQALLYPTLAFRLFTEVGSGLLGIPFAGS